jgi:hypothetical protein
MAGTSRALTLKLLADIDNFTKNINKADNEVTSFGDKIKSFAKVAAAAFAVAGGVAIRFGVDAVKSASDLSETIAKTGEIFGDSAKEVEAFAATAAKRLGQTKQQALDAASTFAIFGRSAGLAGKDLVKFSTDFTSLASDLASFNNTSPEDAINAIGSALRGEAEPLRRYGVLLDDASLRQAALELGIISTTKNALTPQQKVLAAQALIYKQTALAQGDFERTSDGLANQQRILAAQIENVKTTIGTALLPVVLEMTTFFAKNVLPLIEQLGNAFASDGPYSFKSKMSAVVEAIKAVVLPAFNGLVAGFNLIRDAIQRNSDKLEPFFTLIKGIAGFIATILAPALSQTLGLAFKVVGTVISTVINQFSNFLSILTSIFNAIKRIVDFVRGAGDVLGGLLGFNNSSAPSSIPSGPRFSGGYSGQAVNYNNNITVNGAIDPIGTARSISNVLSNAATSTGSFNNLGTSLAYA